MTFAFLLEAIIVARHGNPECAAFASIVFVTEAITLYDFYQPVLSSGVRGIAALECWRIWRWRRIDRRLNGEDFLPSIICIPRELPMERASRCLHVKDDAMLTAGVQVLVVAKGHDNPE